MYIKVYEEIPSNTVIFDHFYMWENQDKWMRVRSDGTQSEFIPQITWSFVMTTVCGTGGFFFKVNSVVWLKLWYESGWLTKFKKKIMFLKTHSSEWWVSDYLLNENYCAIVSINYDMRSCLVVKIAKEFHARVHQCPFYKLTWLISFL